MSQIIIGTPDAEVDLPNGFTLNANVSVSASGVFRLGVPDTGPGTATLNGSLSVTSGGAQIVTSGSAVIDGPSGSSVTVTYYAPETNSPFLMGDGSNVTVNIPMSVVGTTRNLYTPGLTLNSQSSGTLTLTQDTTTANLIALRSHNVVPGKLIFTGILDNTGNTLDFSTMPNVQLQGAVINGGTVANPGSALNGVTLNGVTLSDTLNIPSADSDTFTGGVTGGPGTTINVFGSLILAEQVQGITANLSDGATVTATTSNGPPVTELWNPVTTFNVLGSCTLGSGAGTSPLFLDDQGTVNALPGMTPYAVQVGRPGDTLIQAAGSFFNVFSGASVTIESTLDNQSTFTLVGGEVTVAQQPTGSFAGNFAFIGLNGALQFGTATTPFYAPDGTLIDFSTGDQVVFAGGTYGLDAYVTWSSGVLSVYDTNGTLDGTFTLPRGDNKTYSLSDFVLGPSANGMTLTVNNIAPEGRPGVTAGANATFNTGGASVVLDPTLTVADASSTNLASATVQDINFLPGDTLNYTSQNNITGIYNAITGLLTLSGTDSVVNYQAALQSVTYSYNPANGDPTSGGTLPSRTFAWSVSDLIATSPIDTSTLNLVRVGPSVTTGGIVNANGATPVAVDASLTVADPSSTTLAGAQVAITEGEFFGDGDALAANATGTAITAIYDPTTETLQMTGVDTLANYQAVLRSVTYTITSSDPTNGGTDTTRTITVQVQDAVATSAPASSEVNVACFAAGTAIATPDGDVPVARLAIGDVVAAKFGGRAVVTWIGRRHIDCRRHGSRARSGRCA